MVRLSYLFHLLLTATPHWQASGSGVGCKDLGPLKVVFVLDGSESLAGKFPDQWETARKLFQGFADAYGTKSAAENIHVGIVQFSDRAYVERKMGRGLDAFDDMPRWLDGLDEQTQFKQALKDAGSMINGYELPEDDEKARKLIILLADGAPKKDCGAGKGGILNTMGSIFTLFASKTKPEECKTKDIDIMSVFIRTPKPDAAIPYDSLDIMRRLTPCAALKNGTGEQKTEGAYAVDESGKRCPYLIISTGPNRYREVQENANAFAKAVLMDTSYKDTLCIGKDANSNPTRGSGGGKTTDGSGDYTSKGTRTARTGFNSGDGFTELLEILTFALPITALLCACAGCCFAFCKRRKNKRQREQLKSGFIPGRLSTSHRATLSSKTSRSTHRSGMQSSSRRSKATPVRI